MTIEKINRKSTTSSLNKTNEWVLRFPDFSGAFHYAKPTGQRSVGIPEENGTTFFD